MATGSSAKRKIRSIAKTEPASLKAEDAREGWHKSDYIALYSKEMSRDATMVSGMARSLPGFRLAGIRHWHGLIVVDSHGNTFSVPAVPVVASDLVEYELPKADALIADDRMAGKVKWLMKPLVFGGDPDIPENFTWIDHTEHAKMVKYWNDVYRKYAGGFS